MLPYLFWVKQTVFDNAKRCSCLYLLIKQLRKGKDPASDKDCTCKQVYFNRDDLTGDSGGDREEDDGKASKF